MAITRKTYGNEKRDGTRNYDNTGSALTATTLDEAVTEVDTKVETETVVSVNTQTGTVTLDTDDISEGTTNKYLSDTDKTTLTGGDTTDADSLHTHDSKANAPTTSGDNTIPRMDGVDGITLQSSNLLIDDTGILYVDNIAELTTDVGITIDGCLVKDGSVALSDDIDIASLSEQLTPATGMYLIVDNAGTREKVNWDKLPTTGATTFIGLTDTPTDYTGSASLFVKVNATGDGLEFTAGTSAPVDSVNGQTGVVVLDADDIDDTSTINKFTNATDISKLSGIETGAEVNNISDADAGILTGGSGADTLHTHAHDPYYGFGMVLSNGTDADHDIDISYGVKLSSDKKETIELLSYTKQIDANWTEGDNAGGFPSGLTLSANTWYKVFAIYSQTSETSDAGFDTSATATNLLADATGYNKYRYLGSVLTDASSNIIAFFQDGNIFYWKTKALDLNDTSSVDYTTRTLVSLSVPSGYNVNAIISTNYAKGSNSAVIFTSPDETDQTPLRSLLTDGIGAANVPSSFNRLIVRTNTSSQIYVKSDNSTFTYLNIHTIGWIDNNI
jgi:hypothetical protein